ncbi:squalene monooxygenase SE1 isoform X2 [Medicago truncatula]|uniref:squalene monooxygenase SE1 isoform X2 n=1 Tax=Medicago truncatula TaxID=3880 RepID=UPI0019688488|nr:squalene monooxygenase SE1 isoform X2 [Medicago truncatula]
MDYQYILGGEILACSLAFVFALYIVVEKKKAKEIDSSSTYLKTNGPKNGTCSSLFQQAAGGTDIIIVGAGVAGSALAYTLGKDGRRVHVIERDLNEPDRIVGELLQPGGYLKLLELGLEDCVDEIDAQRVFGYALYKDGKNIKLSYPLENFNADVSGRSFHNGRFIQKMREKASLLPNVKLEQGTVTSLVEINGSIIGVNYKNKSGQEFNEKAPLTIVCDGCFSNLRSSLCKPKIPPELYNSFIAAVDKRNIRVMPNRSMPATPYVTPGALMMGDAFNMRHPLTGGGMTVALSDIVLLRNLLKPLHNLSDVSTLCKYLEPFYTLRKPLSSTVNTLAGLLHTVICVSPDPARKEMREACFDYLSLGGDFSDGPIALLAGLNSRPLSLLYHFIGVATYGLVRLMMPFPSPKRIWLGARFIFVALGIIFPIIKAEGIRQMFFPATVPMCYRMPHIH